MLHAQRDAKYVPQYPTSAFITHLVYLKETEVVVDVQEIMVNLFTHHLPKVWLIAIEHGCALHWSWRQHRSCQIRLGMCSNCIGTDNFSTGGRQRIIIRITKLDNVFARRIYRIFYFHYESTTMTHPSSRTNTIRPESSSHKTRVTRAAPSTLIFIDPKGICTISSIISCPVLRHVNMCLCPKKQWLEFLILRSNCVRLCSSTPEGEETDNLIVCNVLPSVIRISGYPEPRASYDVGDTAIGRLGLPISLVHLQICCIGIRRCAPSWDSRSRGTSYTEILGPLCVNKKRCCETIMMWPISKASW